MNDEVDLPEGWGIHPLVHPTWRRWQKQVTTERLPPGLWVDFDNKGASLPADLRGKWIWYSHKTQHWQELEHVDNVVDALKLAEVLYRMM